MRKEILSTHSHKQKFFISLDKTLSVTLVTPNSPSFLALCNTSAWCFVILLSCSRLQRSGVSFCVVRTAQGLSILFLPLGLRFLYFCLVSFFHALFFFPGLFCCFSVIFGSAVFMCYMFWAMCCVISV